MYAENQAKNNKESINIFANPNPFSQIYKPISVNKTSNIFN